MELFANQYKLQLHRITNKHDIMSAMYEVTGGHVASLIDLCTVMETRGEIDGGRVLLALDATETYDEAIHELFTSSGGVLGFQKALEKKLGELKN